MVIEIPELLSPEETAVLRGELAGANWQDGRMTAGHRAAKFKVNEQLAPDDPLAVELGVQILDRLAQTPLFIAAALPLRVLPPRFSRYEGNGAYGDHVDNAIMILPGGREHLRADVSATLFLSAPDSYDGGELVIEDMLGTHEIKPEAGDLVIYPSSSLHRVAPVTRGTRIAAFFWTQSFVASAEQRRLLFELDGAIQDLTADHPDHASIDNLTGVYHNLLRQWSTT
jgi:PKHD-type hydroxylase